MQAVTGIVRRVDGRRVEVEIESEGCGRCHESGGCGGQNVSRALCRARRYWIPTEASFDVGRRVSIGIDRESVRSAASSAYVVPLVALLAGALMGGRISSGASVAGALLGLAAGWYWLVRSRSRIAAPVILGPAQDDR